MEKKPNLPGYELLEKVGEGAMATVWTARQVSLDRVVAIKILSPQLLRDEEAVERFRLEAQMAAKLNHPGIVQIHDAGSFEGQAYLVMEFVAGCTVAELLERKHRLGEKHALLIAEGVALALAHAWVEARLVHCDVKPANVLIDQDGSIKITDVGLGKVFGANVPGSGPAMLEGTPHYLSPEQARGGCELDCRADIYSLGAMLYHMTTGRLPFGDSAGSEVLQRQLSDYLPDPQQINTTLSEGLAWLIEKMMVKDRTIRYQSWPEVLADMELVQQGDLPSARALVPGQSTVLRSEIRAITQPKPTSKPAPAEDAKKDPEEPKQKAVPKQRIVLPKDMREQVGIAPKPGGELTRAVFVFFLMAGAVVLAYGALSWMSYRRAHPPAKQDYWDRRTETQTLPPRSYVKTANKAEGGASYWKSAEGEGASAGEAAAKSGSMNIQWKHPAFLRGARLFNDALAKYKSYLADRKNPDILKTVEQQCRDAIAAFESCRAFAPPEVKIQELVNQGYRLISDCRQSTLMDSARASSEAPAPVSAIASPAPAAAAPRPADQLVLAPTWNGPQSGGSKIIEDLKELLSNQGQAGVDLKADSSIVLFGQVYYMMPLKDAVKALGKPVSPRKSVNCPGFPKDSLFYYAAEGEFGDGFSKLLLITDSTDHIVAVQLVNEHPDESLWLDPAVFSERWHAYNFVQSQTKGSSKWRVGHRVETVGRIVRIDSELVANDEYGYFGLGDSKERVSLYMPQPLVNLILLRLDKLSEG